jgi:hypothetical protein
MILILRHVDISVMNHRPTQKNNITSYIVLILINSNIKTIITLIASKPSLWTKFYNGGQAAGKKKPA